MDFTLKIWRQKNISSKGKLKTYSVKNISPEMSFLEMLDQLNQGLIVAKEEPVAIDSDCREGICGMCGLIINGRAHGHLHEVTVCETYMRSFKDGQTIVVEPWRARAFPVIKDLIIDRSAFDRINQAGGFISVKTGCAPDAHTMLIPKENSEKAMDAATCIGCGACVAACKNASAMLFVSAKISQLALLPQGQVEKKERVLGMVKAMDKEGFGNCTNEGECEAECPKGIKLVNIGKMFREFYKASLTGKRP